MPLHDPAHQRDLDLVELRTRLEALQRDHDRLARDYERARAESRAKERLLAQVSHELRTPMNGILGITGLTLDTQLDDEQRRYLQMVWSSADSLIAIVNDLLDHAKLEAGKLQVEHIPFNLDMVLGETVASLNVTGVEKGVPVLLETAPGVPGYVAGDPARLRQVLVNLVGNALKFTSSGEVRVVVDADDGGDDDTTLQISVVDTGVGIPADRLISIFDPYEQASASTSREYGGTGLGLAISASLARAMGGDISVESEVGKGSTFRFTLRVRRTEPPPPAAPVDGTIRVLATSDTSLSHRNVLDALADDRYSLRLLDDIDDLPGHIRTAAATGEPFDVAILGLQEDTMERLEVTVREVDTTETAVIVVTPTGQRGDAARCAELGLAGYLTGALAERDLAAAVVAVATGAPSLVTRHWLREQQRPLRILVVDDSPTNRLLANRILERQGHDVIAASGGEEALGIVSDQNLDVVLLDLEMPGMDGVATSRAIRALDPPHNAVPIAAITGHVGDAHRELARNAGMEGFLTKPFHAEQLAEVIARLTDRR